MRILRTTFAGIYGVPKELCAEMYIKALADFSEDYVGSVSEIHFVDVNLEILELIKEAHERWRSSPHTFGFKNALKYPSATLPLGRKKDKMSGSGMFYFNFSPMMQSFFMRTAKTLIRLRSFRRHSIGSQGSKAFSGGELRL